MYFNGMLGSIDTSIMPTLPPSIHEHKLADVEQHSAQVVETMLVGRRRELGSFAISGAESNPNSNPADANQRRPSDGERPRSSDCGVAESPARIASCVLPTRTIVSQQSVALKLTNDPAVPSESAPFDRGDDRVVSDGFELHVRQNERQVVAIPVRTFRDEE